jgi:hypothetical protein
MPSSKIQYTSLDPQVMNGVAQEETSQEIKSTVNTINTNASTAATKATAAANDASAAKNNTATNNTASGTGTLSQKLSWIGNTLIGATNQTGGSATAGTVMAKLNAIIANQAENSGNNHGVAVFSTAGTHQWTCPEGVYLVSAILCGAGGGGGGGGGGVTSTLTGSGNSAVSGSYSGGSGGGGGGAGGINVIQGIPVVPNIKYTVTVGAGGAGGAGGAMVEASYYKYDNKYAGTEGSPGTVGGGT